MISYWKVQWQQILHQVNKTYWKILHKIYVCQNIHLDIWKKNWQICQSYMNIYEYIWQLDMIWKRKQNIVCYRISEQCLSKGAPEIDINTKSTLLCSASSGTVTLTETTRDTMCTSGMIADATSRREKLFKNYTQNAFVWKYPSWHMKKIDRYVRDIYKISFSHMKI